MLAPKASVTDPFETLGVDPRFDLDLRALEARHRDLSGALHPDRYAQRSGAERRMALSKAIEVNAAFRELRDPVRRAEALLGRLGLAREEGQEPPVAPAFLMEILELREALGRARASVDVAEVERLSREVGARENAALLALGRAFSDGSELDLSVIFEKLAELRYFRRFLDEAGAALDEVG